jgi:multiple sugar transport system permease protein
MENQYAETVKEGAFPFPSGTLPVSGGNPNASESKKSSMGHYKLQRFIFRWSISLPGLGAQIIFGWLPLLIGILVSFQDFGLKHSTWCGLSNYRAVFEDPMTAPFSLASAKDYYGTSIKQYQETELQAPNPLIKLWYVIRASYNGLGLVWRNTIYYAVLTLLLTFFVPAIVSILLMEMSPALIRIIMILWWLPIAGMASLILLKYFYNVDYGLLNGLLAKFYDIIGKPVDQRVYPRWLNSPQLAMLCLVLPDLIMFTPGLVYIAALQGIPQDLYDAAEIDGCGFFQKIWHVTLPRLRPILVTMLIFSVLGAFQVMEQVMIMTGGGPANTTMVMGYYIYKMTFDYLEVGKGNALAVVFCIFLLALTILQRAFIKEDTDRGEDKATLKAMKEG